MIPHKLSSLFLLALALVATGCAVWLEPADPTFTVSAEYTPLRYQGYVVYYDRGVPFYVVDGRRYVIPRARRDRYIQHYHLYRDHPAYREWRTRRYPTRGPRRDYRSRGPRYRDPQLRHRPR